MRIIAEAEAGELAAAKHLPDFLGTAAPALAEGLRGVRGASIFGRGLADRCWGSGQGFAGKSGGEWGNMVEWHDGELELMGERKRCACG